METLFIILGDFLINQAENFGFDKSNDIKSEYPENYRNNQRMININKILSQSLWARIQLHLKTKDIINVTPVGMTFTRQIRMPLLFHEFTKL
jgi:hypothetical protein